MRIFLTCLTMLLSFCCFAVEVQQCKCPQKEELPLYKPSVSQEEVLLFAAEAAMSAYEYNYSNYRRRFQETSRFFSPSGWRIFLESMKNSGDLNEVLDKKLIVKAVPTDAPIIVAQNLIDGIYTWQVQLPMLVIFEGNKGRTKKEVVLTIHIRRTNQFVGINNIAIDAFFSAQRQESTAGSTMKEHT